MVLRNQKQVFQITVVGVTMQVSYDPSFPSSVNVVHLEFRSLNEQAIPVSSTGYRSHFTFTESIETVGSVQEYAVAYAKAKSSKKKLGYEPTLEEILRCAGKEVGTSLINTTEEVQVKAEPTPNSDSSEQDGQQLELF